MSEPSSAGILEEELAAFVYDTSAERLPRAVLATGRRLLLDALASGLAGRATEDAPRMERLARDVVGPGGSAVIGGPDLAPLGAALLNGYLVTAATVCDVHRPTLTHVTPEVVPAALAAAQEGQADGASLLAAVVVGCEVAVRVAQALDNPAYAARGWHNPGIAGTIGAAAAAGKLLGLDEPAIRWTFGHASSQAAGTFAALGTAGVKLHQARGAMSGVLSAWLAATGMSGASAAFSAPRGGLLAAYADGGVPERLTAGLGGDWRLEEISLRRWPAASSLQPVIAATLAARDDPAIAGQPIAAARVGLPARGFALNATSGWEDQLSALQSARWIAAVVVRDGDCWLQQTMPARLVDASTDRFARESVTVELDEARAAGGASVTLRTASGRTAEHHVAVPPGDPGAPLSDEDLRAKLVRAADSAGRPGAAASILAAVDDLRGASTISPLLEALRG